MGMCEPEDQPHALNNKFIPLPSPYCKFQTRLILQGSDGSYPNKQLFLNGTFWWTLGIETACSFIQLPNQRMYRIYPRNPVEDMTFEESTHESYINVFDDYAYRADVMKFLMKE